MSEVRLIDAEALKKHIIDVFDTEVKIDKKWAMGLKYSLKIIDNAKTVIPDNDIFEWCTDCKEYDQEKHCCHRWSSKIRETIEEVKQYKLDELRPQGESYWVMQPGKTASIPSYYIWKCKYCGRDAFTEKPIAPDVPCPNCLIAAQK